MNDEADQAPEQGTQPRGPRQLAVAWLVTLKRLRRLCDDNERQRQLAKLAREKTAPHQHRRGRRDQLQSLQRRGRR